MVECKSDLEKRLDDEQRLLLERFVEASDILSSVIESEMIKNALSMGMKLMMEVKKGSSDSTKKEATRLPFC